MGWSWAIFSHMAWGGVEEREVSGPGNGLVPVALCLNASPVTHTFFFSLSVCAPQM